MRKSTKTVSKHVLCSLDTLKNYLPINLILFIFQKNIRQAMCKTSWINHFSFGSRCSFLKLMDSIFQYQCNLIQLWWHFWFVWISCGRIRSDLPKIDQNSPKYLKWFLEQFYIPKTFIISSILNALSRFPSCKILSQ